MHSVATRFQRLPPAVSGGSPGNTLRTSKTANNARGHNDSQDKVSGNYEWSRGGNMPYSTSEVRDYNLFIVQSIAYGTKQGH